MPDLQTEAITVNAARNEILHLIYDGKDKILSSGLAKGNAVDVQRTIAKVTSVAGFYGEPYYYESGNDSAKVTINAKDGSETNNILQALYNNQFNDTSNTMKSFGLMIEYKDKDKKVILDKCVIDNQPKESMNDSDYSMVWSILACSVKVIAKKPNDPDIPWSDATVPTGTVPNVTVPNGIAPSK